MDCSSTKFNSKIENNGCDLVANEVRGRRVQATAKHDEIALAKQLLHRECVSEKKVNAIVM